MGPNIGLVRPDFVNNLGVRMCSELGGAAWGVEGLLRESSLCWEMVKYRLGWFRGVLEGQKESLNVRWELSSPSSTP